VGYGHAGPLPSAESRRSIHRKTVLEQQYPFSHPHYPDPLQQRAQALRSELIGLFDVSQVGIRPGGETIYFGGRLLYTPEAAYDEIARRFARHGFTPMFHRERGQDVVVAVAGLTGKVRTGNPLVNVLLLLATIMTTLAAGASMRGQDLFAAMATGDLLLIREIALVGAPFSVTLLAILGVHELGHYVAARWHGVAASLPYFIPLPFAGLGTLGAFIAIKSPMKDRRVLFDIGLAGPLAGFVVALPLLLVGLTLSPEVPGATGGLTLRALGSSVLVTAVVDAVREIPPGRTLALHPVFFAAWLGLLLTSVNLLPVGQLDGGHVAYALLGRWAHGVAMLTFVGLIAAGALISSMWYIWAFFVFLGGLRHPPTMNDLTRLTPLRWFLGLLAVLLFVFTIVPAPFR
jgi:membrane-associated protease RseP (regulator of RpoE activity)